MPRDSAFIMTTEVKKTVLSKKETECAEAVESLKNYLKPGDTVYTILRSVSASGMCRCLDLLTIQDNQPWRLTWSVATALDRTYDKKRSALRVSGAGTDVGFDTVYNLSWKLFGDGYALNHRWL